MKGIITCYIDREEESNSDNQKQLINLIVEKNQEAINFAKEAGYLIMFLPTTNEASRVEKVDLDQPFPFYPIKNEVK